MVQHAHEHVGAPECCSQGWNGILLSPSIPWVPRQSFRHPTGSNVVCSRKWEAHLDVDRVCRQQRHEPPKGVDLPCTVHVRLAQARVVLGDELAEEGEVKQAERRTKVGKAAPLLAWAYVGCECWGVPGTGQEERGCGCGFIDLVSLVTGSWRPQQPRALADCVLGSTHP